MPASTRCAASGWNTRQISRLRPVLVAIVVSFAGSGCTSRECSTVGCAYPPVQITAPLGTAAGPYDVTFCKGGDCEHGTAHLSTDSPDVVNGSFDLVLGGWSTDGGAGTLLAGVSASDYTDGETLSLDVLDASGASVVHWSTPVTYARATDVGGPGCGTCVTFAADTSR